MDLKDLAADYFKVIVRLVLSLYGVEGRGSNSSTGMDSSFSYDTLLQEKGYWRREFISKT